jgi:hypothetical protein
VNENNAKLFLLLDIIPWYSYVLLAHCAWELQTKMFLLRVQPWSRRGRSLCNLYQDGKCSPLKPGSLNTSTFLQLGSPPLSQRELTEALATIPGWEFYQDNKIIRRFDVKNFLGGVEFIESLAQMAEEEGHHPGIWMAKLLTQRCAPDRIQEPGRRVLVSRCWWSK